MHYTAVREDGMLDISNEKVHTYVMLKTYRF